MALRVWLWLLSLTVLWGGSFFFAKVALGELGPFTVAFARVSLAALALALLVPLRRDAPWRTYFAMGFLNNALPFSLIFWARPRSPQAWPRSSTPPRRFSLWSSPTSSRRTRRSTGPRSLPC